tara:strand:+ start:3591 stop:5945 length:2355 start_codon:yes stop_codon:yes gene_type:complete
MQKNSVELNDIPKYVLVILYIITGSLTNFGAIDILAPQWIYLGSINILTCLYILFFSSNTYYDSFQRLFSTAYIYIYIFYFIWNGLSYFYAVNPVETLINLPRIGNTFFAILFCYLLISTIYNKYNFIFSIFFLFLLAEMISYYYDLSQVYPKEGLRVIAIKGFAGNKNITAASIAFKIPFAIYLYLNTKKIVFKIITFVILVAGILAISLIEARAAILSSIIVFILLISFFIYKLLFDKEKKYAKVNFITIGYLLAPYIIAFLINIFATNFANDKYRKVAITDTIGKISFTEQSSNGRFNYWGDAWSYIKENPILASGLGNWKIESIDRGKEHISGYTVPYHAHNDFVHVFAETGVFGGVSYALLFSLIIFYLFKILKRKFYSDSEISLKEYVLILPLIVYGIDALLNFPVARPLMQSSLAIYLGTVLSIYTGFLNKVIKIKRVNIFSIGVLVLSLTILIPGLYIHFISFKSLKQQGRLLYEFNNAQYTYTRDELDQISHTFPNLTETAMPIKAMKARYYYLSGNKKEAHQMAYAGILDNPKIHFGDNLKATFFLQENNIDSSYHYAKKAFNGLPNNMPHYDIYMRTLAFKRDAVEINNTFERVRKLGGDTKGIWTIYLRTLALTRSLGDPFSMAKAQEAFKMYPTDDNIFQLYRILTYGQSRIAEADQFAAEAKKLFDSGEFNQAGELYIKAFDKDPLQYSHSLNAALTFYNLKDFENALKYFNLSKSSKDPKVYEKSLRFNALTLFSIGDNVGACADFIKLLNRFPKRMYQQEFNKYCRSK